MQSWAERFYKSVVWQRRRETYAKKHMYLCEDCLSRGVISRGEIVHHKIFLTAENINDPNITLAEENLELLCRDCHAKRHGTKNKRYIVDEFGNVKAK